MTINKSDLKEFIREFKDDHYIDFRSDVFLENQYGNTPTFTYDRADILVHDLHNRLEAMFGDEYIIYNSSMEIEKLRCEKLKDYIDDVVFTYLHYYLDQCK